MIVHGQAEGLLPKKRAPGHINCETSPPALLRVSFYQKAVTLVIPRKGHSQLEGSLLRFGAAIASELFLFCFILESVSPPTAQPDAVRFLFGREVPRAEPVCTYSMA
jgi:hypothetical protein